jgi:molybdopterin-guanine dinucleotide biosynthesis protein A
VVGAILAGGLGRRMGADKAARELAGRPLVAYPAAALASVCDRVAVIAKADTALPELDGVEVWVEPDSPRHPIAGVVHALSTAGEEVLVCAADMPFVIRAALRELLAEARPPATIAYAGGRLQPLLGVYWPEALPALRAAPPDAPLTRTVESLPPWLVELPPELVRSIDTPEALAAAEQELSG